MNLNKLTPLLVGATIAAGTSIGAYLIIKEVMLKLDKGNMLIGYILLVTFTLMILAIATSWYHSSRRNDEP